jgi:hypothetical protein
MGKDETKEEKKRRRGEEGKRGREEQVSSYTWMP